jgi:hypothetical protein
MQGLELCNQLSEEIEQRCRRQSGGMAGRFWQQASRAERRSERRLQATQLGRRTRKGSHTLLGPRSRADGPVRPEYEELKMSKQVVDRDRSGRQIVGFSLSPALAAEIKLEARRRKIRLRALLEEMWADYKRKAG